MRAHAERLLPLPAMMRDSRGPTLFYVWSLATTALVLVGTRLEVLVEGVSDKDASRMMGRTRGFRKNTPSCRLVTITVPLSPLFGPDGLAVRIADARPVAAAPPARFDTDLGFIYKLHVLPVPGSCGAGYDKKSPVR